jgi:hypothetical protein
VKVTAIVEEESKDPSLIAE